MRDVAQPTGLSIGFLSQVERDVLAPSVNALKRIAEALGLRVGRRMLDATEPPGTSPLPVLRSGDRTRIALRNRPSVTSCSPPTCGGGRRCFGSPPSLARKAARPFSREGEDGVVVPDGQLEVEAGGVWHILEAGDGIYVSSEVPHRWRNSGHTEAEATWMSTPPSF